MKLILGTILDMKNARLAIQEQVGREKRPCILRKDFIFDRYQILEARAYGADTILLIVAVLGQQQLKDLIYYARQYKMEPLVEVNTIEEMRIAVQAGAKVIGINNRNLHTFQLDLSTTEQCLSVIPIEDRSKYCFAALSGISSREEVEQFQRLGVQCCLVGETLMKANDPKTKLLELFQITSSTSTTATNSKQQKLVKVCGMKDINQVQQALQSKVNMIGMIFAANSKRRIQDLNIVKQIVQTVQAYGERNSPLTINDLSSVSTTDELQWYNQCAKNLQKITLRRPLTVGVFQDQSMEEVQSIVKATGIDLIQLHGQEGQQSIEEIAKWKELQIPLIKVIHIDISSNNNNNNNNNNHLEEIHQLIWKEAKQWKGIAHALLVDAKTSQMNVSGGLGQSFDWSILTTTTAGLPPLLLAGGITTDNIQDLANLQNTVFGIDVNSGVEKAPGDKDITKIRHLMNTIPTLV
jgi:anthranilate synthase / indole-3-glycerol phosphate synthase / phosphoribosylanthranilate isomerase